MKSIGLLKALALTYQADKMDTEKRVSLQQRRLQELIAYVKKNSPYFAQLYQNIDEKSPLAAYPTTNKIEMAKHFDEWFTDRSITKEVVDDFMMDLSNVGKKLNGKYLVYTTSGSTGTPCIVLYDETTIHVSSAIGMLRSFAQREDMKAFLKSGGKTLALFADNGFYLGTGSIKYQLHKMPWKKKKMKTFDVRNPISQIVSMLNAYQPSMIGCYPSTMELLAYEQERGNLHIHPSIIMTGGEALNEEIRAHLSQVFNCSVQTNYSCTEGGTVACECVERHFHLNDDWIILEPVDENNTPVPFGTQSAKVLLTNLANKVCPIIRFEITDRIILHNEPCSCGNSKPWLTLEGRTDDILVFKNGIQIAPLALYAILKEIAGIERFQLIQHKNDDLELRVLAQKQEDCFFQAKQALEIYFQQNGLTPNIYLSKMSPSTHPISGKYQHILSYKKSDL